MPVIGVSTGWFHAKGVSMDLEEIAPVIRAAEADGIEVVLPEDYAQLRWCPHPLSNHFRYVSMHLPDFDYVAREREHLSPAHQEHLRDIAQWMQANGMPVGVLHPSFVPFYLYEVLEEYKIPFAIENMDPNKVIGCSITDIEHLLNVFGVAGVLDLEHAYQCSKASGGNGRDLGMQFFHMMTASPHHLAHLHVSGQRGNHDHVLLRDADNKTDILWMLSQILSYTDLPIILEGDPFFDLPEGEMMKSKTKRLHLLQQSIDVLAQEIHLIRKEIGI